MTMNSRKLRVFAYFVVLLCLLSPFGLGVRYISATSSILSPLGVPGCLKFLETKDYGILILKQLDGFCVVADGSRIAANAKDCSRIGLKLIPNYGCGYQISNDNSCDGSVIISGQQSTISKHQICTEIRGDLIISNVNDENGNNEDIWTIIQNLGKLKKIGGKLVIESNKWGEKHGKLKFENLEELGDSEAGNILLRIQNNSIQSGIELDNLYKVHCKSSQCTEIGNNVNRVNFPVQYMISNVNRRSKRAAGNDISKRINSACIFLGLSFLSAVVMGVFIALAFVFEKEEL